MSTKSNTLSDLSSQIINYNNNLVAILEGLNRMVATRDATVEIKLTDNFGNVNTTLFPTVNSLQSQLTQIKREIDLLTNLDGNGAFIKNEDGSFRKVISVNLNRQPTTLQELNTITVFESKPNWFFDSMLSQLLTVNIDLTNKVSEDVWQIDSNRFIVKFDEDVDGNITELGTTARTSFNNTFKGKLDINYEDFITWTKDTAGINEIINDIQRFDLEPNYIRYDGTFGVTKTEEDAINKRIWYVLDQINYNDRELNIQKTLNINDVLIINDVNMSTRYKILEINTTNEQPKVRVERIDGNDPIPVGRSVLKIYSPISNKRNVKINVGFDEYQVIFVRPIKGDNYVRADEWSLGIGFYSNDLRLNSSDKNLNGLTMSEYYVNRVYDYGLILLDEVRKKIPTQYAETPIPPILNAESFTVRVRNQHLTNSKDSEKLRSLNNEQTRLKTEIEQLNDGINELKEQIQNAGVFPTKADQQKAEVQLRSLTNQKDAKSNQLKSVVADILSTQNALSNVTPQYRVQGFWQIPEPLQNTKSRPQQIVQFIVRYKYANINGEETPIQTIPVTINGKIENGAVSQWEEIKTKPRIREFDPITGFYNWVDEVVSDSDTTNTNFLDLGISPNERVTFKVKSVSEVNYPDNPITSDWSEQITIEFPSSLQPTNDTNQNILTQTLQEDQRIRFENELTARGITDHISKQRSIAGQLVVHDAIDIFTTERTTDGRQKNLEEVINELRKQITDMQEVIQRAKGKMEVFISKNGIRTPIQNGNNLQYNIILTKYAEALIDSSGLPTWSNREYTINDWKIIIKNASTNNPLGLFSKNLESNVLLPFNNDSNFRSLLTDPSGAIKKQNDYQFIWSLGYGLLNNNTLEYDWTDLSNLDIAIIRNYNIGWLPSTYQQGIIDKDPDASNEYVHELLKKIQPSPALDGYSASSVHIQRSAGKNDLVYQDEYVKTVFPNGEIEIPIAIYFLLDNRSNSTGTLNSTLYQPNDLSEVIRDTALQQKKLSIVIEPENSEKPFKFNLTFNIRANDDGDRLFNLLGEVPIFAPLIGGRTK